VNLIERLRARKQSFYSEATRASEWRTEPLCADAATEIERLTAQVEVMREALEPFARVASEWDGEPASLNVEFCAYDGPRMNPSALVVDFRHAALSYRGGD